MLNNGEITTAGGKIRNMTWNGISHMFDWWFILWAGLGMNSSIYNPLVATPLMCVLPQNNQLVFRLFQVRFEGCSTLRDCGWKKSCITGRMVENLEMIGETTYELVQDLFHPLIHRSSVIFRFQNFGDFPAV